MVSQHERMKQRTKLYMYQYYPSSIIPNHNISKLKF